MFDNLATDSNIEEQGDSLGGARILNSGPYNFNVDIAYFAKADSGAMSLNLVLKDGDSELKETLWITSGDAKGNKNYYEKDGKKSYLPSFNQANALCLLTIGKELKDIAQSVEDKVINLYNFEQKKDVPTKVQMVMDLLNQQITAGVLKQIVDKQKKGADGKYANTGETREQNEINKMFRTSDKMTVAEVRAKASDAEFYDAWCIKWNGKVQDKSSSTGGKPAAGTPQGATGAAATTPLFGG